MLMDALPQSFRIIQASLCIFEEYVNQNWWWLFWRFCSPKISFCSLTWSYSYPYPYFAPKPDPNPHPNFNPNLNPKPQPNRTVGLANFFRIQTREW